MKNIKCLECNIDVANSRNVLSRHIKLVHMMSWEQYVIKHEYEGKHPECLCGCKTKLKIRKGGFGKYVNGHDITPQQDKSIELQISSGYVMNPFTSKEEAIDDIDCIEFLKHCIRHNDFVTSDHGIRIPWDDELNKVRFFKPSFKHMTKNMLFFIDNVSQVSDANAKNRMDGYKAWCELYGYVGIVIKRINGEFYVSNAFGLKHKK